MAKVKGSSVLVKVNTGTAEAPVWTNVAGQTGGTLERSRETIEATTKDSATKEFMVGHKEWSIACEGLYVVGDAGYQALEAAYDAGEFMLVIFELHDGSYYEGLALPTELPIEAPADDLMSWSTTFQGSGDLIKKPAPVVGEE